MNGKMFSKPKSLIKGEKYVEEENIICSTRSIYLHTSLRKRQFATQKNKIKNK